MDKLKPCPFCGGIPNIIVCDDEGNEHNSDYEENPWSGLGFMLEHDREGNEDCPIARYAGEALGCWIYDTREEAIKAWNTRHESNK